VTTAETTDRIENPHRPEARPPVLSPHPFRPGTLGAGLALTGLGAVFMAQQLGALALGPAATVAVLTLAAAVLVIAVAIGWSRRDAES
jgi:hypothetical protein